MKTMEKLYYIKGELGRESDVIEKLRSLGLNVSVIESHCYEYDSQVWYSCGVLEFVYICTQMSTFCFY